MARVLLSQRSTACRVRFNETSAAAAVATLAYTATASALASLTAAAAATSTDLIRFADSIQFDSFY